MMVRAMDSSTIIKATPTDGCRTLMPIGVPADATPTPIGCHLSLLDAESGTFTRFILPAWPFSPPFEIAFDG
jgi:hypothetical protein